MPANSQHSEYQDSLSIWATVRDCVKGSKAVKKAKTKYLPKPNPEDASEENSKRYDDYVNRANFVNFTNSTLEGMMGMVFRKPMEVELQNAIEYLKVNANGGGLTLEQMTKSLISNTLQTGRYGLLVDYPQAEEGLSKAAVQVMNLRANIIQYKPESIINWETTIIGGIKMLSMVVLEEATKIPTDDPFVTEVKKYHRVLLLKNGIYIQQLLDDKDNQVGGDIIPKDSTGATWKEIPFIFVGSQNNDECVDKAPLYDIAEINISHYRNSADFEESCFIVGQPTPVISGLSQSWVKEVMKDGVVLGSRSAVLLPENGSAALLQADSNQMPEKGMEMKEQQMIKIGARIIQDSSGVETAEAAKIRFAGQNSKLGTIVGNVEAALLKCMEWAMRFMGGTGENMLKLNREFYDARIDPQLVIAQIQLLDRGIIGKTDLRSDLRSGGMIERTDDEIDKEAEDITVM